MFVVVQSADRHFLSLDSPIKRPSEKRAWLGHLSREANPRKTVRNCRCETRKEGRPMERCVMESITHVHNEEEPGSAHPPAPDLTVPERLSPGPSRCARAWAWAWLRASRAPWGGSRLAWRKGNRVHAAEAALLAAWGAPGGHNMSPKV